MEKLQPAVKDDFKLMNLESTTKKINETMNKVKDDFMYIGFLLWEINYLKHYESKGYCSVVEYAEKELGFKQATTYNFISICDKFAKKRESGYPTIHLDEKFKDFNFTQLVEIKSLNLEQINQITPDMSKREIREKKKELKKEFMIIENNIIDVEIIQDQVDLKENQINISEAREKSIPIYESSEKDVIEYLNDRLEVLRSLAKGQKKDSNDRIKYLAGAYEVELLIDFINKKGDEFFLD